MNAPMSTSMGASMGASMGIAGCGFWAPGFPDSAALASAAGEAAGDADARPPLAILGKRAGARASMLTRMMAEVVAQAARQASVDLSTVASVYGSSHGEIQRMAELVSTPPDRPVSPLRFQVSVHNAAAGLITIATGNRGFSTSLSAGDDTVLAALWEAKALLCTHPAVVLAVGDETLPLSMSGPQYAPCAAAFVLTATTTDAIATLEGPKVDSLQSEGPKVDSLQSEGPKVDSLESERPVWPAELARFDDHPCRGAVLLARALAAGTDGPIQIGGKRGRPASVLLTGAAR